MGKPVVFVYNTLPRTSLKVGGGLLVCFFFKCLWSQETLRFPWIFFSIIWLLSSFCECSCLLWRHPGCQVCHADRCSTTNACKQQMWVRRQGQEWPRMAGSWDSQTSQYMDCSISRMSTSKRAEIAAALFTRLEISTGKRKRCHLYCHREAGTVTPGICPWAASPKVLSCVEDGECGPKVGRESHQLRHSIISWGTAALSYVRAGQSSVGWCKRMKPFSLLLPTQCYPLTP